MLLTAGTDLCQQVSPQTSLPSTSRLFLEDDPDPLLTALNLAILKDLWMPDVEIRNLQSFETHTILSKLEGLWVDEEHNLMHALASRITFICPMRFNSFPMDVQVRVLSSSSQFFFRIFFDLKFSEKKLSVNLLGNLEMRTLMM